MIRGKVEPGMHNPQRLLAGSLWGICRSARRKRRPLLPGERSKGITAEPRTQLARRQAALFKW